MTRVQTNAYVESISRERLMRDYYIAFVIDCTATEHPKDHEATARNIENLFEIAIVLRINSGWGKDKGNAIPRLGLF